MTAKAIIQIVEYLASVGSGRKGRLEEVITPRAATSAGKGPPRLHAEKPPRSRVTRGLASHVA
jgi:hypothetical protein